MKADCSHYVPPTGSTYSKSTPAISQQQRMPNQEALYFKVCGFARDLFCPFSPPFIPCFILFYFTFFLSNLGQNKPHFQVEFALHVNPSEWQNQSFPTPPFFDLTQIIKYRAFVPNTSEYKNWLTIPTVKEITSHCRNLRRFYWTFMLNNFKGVPCCFYIHFKCFKITSKNMP